MIERKLRGIGELAEDMLYLADEGAYVVAALFYDEAAELLRELMIVPMIDIHDIILETAAGSGYTKEYYIELTGDYDLTVEPAFVNGRYLETDCDAMFIDGDANSRIIADLPEDVCIEVDFDGDDCDDGYDDESVRVKFSVDEDILEDLQREPDVYATLLEIISDAFLAADFEFDDENELECAYVDIRDIFDELRNC